MKKQAAIHRLVTKMLQYDRGTLPWPTIFVPHHIRCFMMCWVPEPHTHCSNLSWCWIAIYELCLQSWCNIDFQRLANHNLVDLLGGIWVGLVSWRMTSYFTSKFAIVINRTVGYDERLTTPWSGYESVLPIGLQQRFNVWISRQLK